MRKGCEPGLPFTVAGLIEMARSDPDSGIDDSFSASGVLPGDVLRALRWLREHLSETIELDVLADAAGVRPRTLETHFRIFLGTTPLGWARRMRLALARQEFIRRGQRTTVTAVALNSGFTQLGRFAAEYRRAFGELPSATVARAKGLPTPTFDEDVDEAIRQTLMHCRLPSPSKERDATSLSKS